MSEAENNSPTVSVVIPCYNGQAYLRETIESALRQTHAPREILVVDDGSTDESAQIAESFGPPVRVIRQSNQGESVARNRGLDEAQGDWVAFLDADDLWRPEKLAEQLAASREEIWATHTDYSCFGDRDEVVALSEQPPEERYDLARLCTLQNKDFNLSSLMVRREYPGRFPTWTKYAEDLLYFAELLLNHPDGVALVPVDLVAKRRHVKRQSANPRIQLHWHETLMRWTDEKANQLPAGVPEQIKAALIHHLVEQTHYRYWHRDWENYWVFRNQLARHAENEEVQELLEQRVYPAWIYKMKDWLDRQRGVQPSSASAR